MGRRNTANISNVYFQVWRPSHNGDTEFEMVNEIPLEENKIVQYDSSNIVFNMHLDHGNRINVKAGDVIGYYQSSSSSYCVQNARAMGYTAFVSQVSNSPNSLNTNDMLPSVRQQPLVQIELALYTGEYMLRTTHVKIFMMLAQNRMSWFNQWAS